MLMIMIITSIVIDGGDDNSYDDGYDFHDLGSDTAMTGLKASSSDFWLLPSFIAVNVL